MFRKLIYALACAGLIWCGPVAAKKLLGKDVNKWCTSHDKQDQLKCSTYISGTIDTIVTFGEMGLFKRGKLVCPTGDASPERLKELFVNHLQKKPEAMEIYAPLAVLVSMKTFRC